MANLTELGRRRSILAGALILLLLSCLHLINHVLHIWVIAEHTICPRLHLIVSLLVTSRLSDLQGNLVFVRVEKFVSTQFDTLGQVHHQRSYVLTKLRLKKGRREEQVLLGDPIV